MNKVFVFGNSSTEKFPETPGVYLFKDTFGTIIYIGKAINLKNRIKSYFSQGLYGKTKHLVESIKTIEIINTANEIESLILESILIKKHLPKYNIQLKDGKNYLYIKISDEKYPRVLTSRKDDGKVKYKYIFGPYPSSGQTKTLMKLIRRFIPYSTHKPSKNVCLENQIGLCVPCPSEIEKIKHAYLKKQFVSLYRNNIRKVVKILKGNIISIKKDLLLDIKRCSINEDFEKAIALRNKLSLYEYVAQKRNNVQEFLKNPNFLEDTQAKQILSLMEILNQNTYLARIECFDIAHISGSYTTASMVVFVNGSPDKRLYRRFKIIRKKYTDDISSMKEVSERRYYHISDWGKPDMILVDGGLGQLKQFLTVFSNTGIVVSGYEKRSGNLIFQSSEGGKFIRVNLKESPAKYLIQNLISEAHRFSRRYHHLLIKKAIFNDE